MANENKMSLANKKSGRDLSPSQNALLFLFVLVTQNRDTTEIGGDGMIEKQKKEEE